MQCPLEGIVVLDFTNNGAGPCCSMLLGDFGAEVIKVEPLQGDSSRQWGSTRVGQNNHFTPTYIALNRNKHSIALDLKSPDGQRIVQDLLARADIVIESFTPGVADRLGIGYQDVSAKRPEIIYCSVSGFGQTGPLASRAGFDMLLQAHCGHMSITGEEGRPSVRNGPSSIDFLTGAHAAFGIMLALRHRDQTGRGQLVDSCLFDWPSTWSAITLPNASSPDASRERWARIFVACTLWNFPRPGSGILYRRFERPDVATLLPLRRPAGAWCRSAVCPHGRSATQSRRDGGHSPTLFVSGRRRNGSTLPSAWDPKQPRARSGRAWPRCASRRA